MNIDFADAEPRLSHSGLLASSTEPAIRCLPGYSCWRRSSPSSDPSPFANPPPPLYAPDCALESPLVRHLLSSAEGVVAGREKLREFVQMVFAHQPAARQRYRKGFFTDGRTLMWEYPRTKPDGEQMDFVEVMEIRDGLIHRHRIYWGWFGLKLLQEGSHHAK
jgi:hypothetical protein